MDRIQGKSGSGFRASRDQEREVQALTHFSYAQHLVLDGRGNEALAELRAALMADPDSAYLHEVLAYVLLQQDNPDQALALIEQAIKINPDRAVAHHLLGLTLLAKSQAAQAENAFLTALEMDPDNPEYAINLADARISQGKNKEALAGLREFSLGHPEALEPQYYAANILQGIGRLDQAAKVYRNIIMRAPGYYPALHDLFRLEAARGNLEGAVNLGRVLLSLYPGDTESRFFLANVLVRRGEDEKALQVLEEGKHSGVLIPDWWISQGIILLKNKRTEEAREEFEAALSLDPQNSEAVFYLGLTELALKNPVEATAYFESVPEGSEAYAEARQQLAMIALRLGESERAITIMERLLEKNPDNLMVLVMLSAVCRDAGKYERAESALKEALAKIPDDENLWYELGLVYYLQGREEEAIAVMEKIIEKNPKSSRALNFIGYSWAEQGVRLDEAEAMIRRALEMEPDAGYIMDSLGWVYFQRGSYQSALEWLNKAREAEGPDSEIIEHIGDCYWKMGNKRKARESYEEALENTTSERIKLRIEKKIEELK